MSFAKYNSGVDSDTSDDLDPEPYIKKMEQNVDDDVSPTIDEMKNKIPLENYNHIESMWVELEEEVGTQLKTKKYDTKKIDKMYVELHNEITRLAVKYKLRLKNYKRLPHRIKLE